MSKDEALASQKDKALRLALEALGHFEKAGLATLKTIDAITAIKQALEETQGVSFPVATSDTSQKPVDEIEKQRHEPEPEWYHGIDAHGCNRFYHKTEVRPSEFNTPLYTSPQRAEGEAPKREPLADDELIQKILDAGFERNSLGWTFTYGRLDYHLLKFARAIEAAHGITGEQHEQV